MTHSIRLHPLRELHFDPENPRLPKNVDGNSEADVLDWLLREETLLELMAAIGEQDYFEGEPLLVVPRGKKPGFFVVEGNRRLAAVRLLNEPELAPTRKDSVRQIAADARFHPENLPAIEFVERENVLLYLGYRHITGVKEWSPLAKARYLRQLAGSGKVGRARCQQLARQIGSKPDYVARLLTGLTIFEKIELDAETRSNAEDNFSLLTTALSYESIATFIGLDSGATDPSATGLGKKEARELLEWMFKPLASGGTRLGESRRLKELASVVENPRALIELRKGKALEVAVELTDHPAAVLLALVVAARERLERANQTLPSVDKPPQGIGDQLSEVQNLAKAIRRWSHGVNEE